MENFEDESNLNIYDKGDIWSAGSFQQGKISTNNKVLSGGELVFCDPIASQ